MAEPRQPWPVAAALLAAALAGMPFVDASANTMEQDVDGYRFQLVVSAPPPGSGHDQANAAGHRVVLRAFERSVGHPVPLRDPVLQLRGTGGTARIYPMHLIDPRADPAYEAVVPLAAPGMHRLVVLARPGGLVRTLSAQFDYRHRD